MSTHRSLVSLAAGLALALSVGQALADAPTPLPPVPPSPPAAAAATAAPTPASAPAAAANAAPQTLVEASPSVVAEAAKMTCRQVKITGSNVRTRKVCSTPNSEQKAQDWVQQQQAQGGIYASGGLNNGT